MWPLTIPPGGWSLPPRQVTTLSIFVGNLRNLGFRVRKGIPSVGPSLRGHGPRATATQAFLRTANWTPRRKHFANGHAHPQPHTLACMVWHGMAWPGVAWHGVVWHGMVWGGMAWCGMACGMAWCGMAESPTWCGVAWHGVAWRGVVWRGLSGTGMAWRGMAWCGVCGCVGVSVCVLCVCVCVCGCECVSCILNPYLYS